MSTNRSDDETAVLAFSDADACREALEDVRTQGALLVTMEAAPKLLEPMEIRFEVENRPATTISARPVQSFPGADGIQVAFEISSADLDKLENSLSKGEATDDESETRGTSPLLRIKEMNPNERARLALNCGRNERRILRRDRSPQVLLNLLNNPRSDAEDALAVVKSPQVNTGILERVASDRRWMGNQEIRTAVVRSPKTSPPTAIRLLESLGTEDLRKLARIGSCRETVRRAAMRAYQKRQGQR